MVQRQLRLTTAAAPLPPTDLALAAAAEPQEKVKATRKGSVWVGEEEGQPSEEAGLPLELGWTEGFGIYRCRARPALHSTARVPPLHAPPPLHALLSMLPCTLSCVSRPALL